MINAESWYAIFCAPRKESEADRKLRQRGYRTFFPHTAEWIEASRRKSRLVKVAYLPRYVFVAFRPERAHLESAFEVNNIRDDEGNRMCALVCAGGEPFPIFHEEIENIFNLCDPLDGQIFCRKAKKPKWLFAAGDSVKLGDSKGALRGLSAIVEALMPDGSLRVRLNRAIMGQDIITVKPTDLEEVRRVS